MARANITAVEKVLASRGFEVATSLSEPTVLPDGSLQVQVTVSGAQRVTLAPDQWSAANARGKRRRRSGAQIQAAIDSLLKVKS